MRNTGKQTRGKLWNFSHRAECNQHRVWIFPILTSADHLVGIWLPQHAIKITRKIPTVKFLNPPRCSSTNSTEIPSRSLSSLEIYTSFIRARIIVLTLASCIIQIFCYRLKEISKKKKNEKSSKTSFFEKIVGSKNHRIEEDESSFRGQLPPTAVISRCFI